jgi:RNA polymerase sigma factor (sigma-70 family)
MSAAPAGEADEDGFKRFYMATSEHVFRRALWASGNNRDVAYDALQETYLAMCRCWEKWRHRTPDENRRYAVGIATNKVNDHFRRGRLTAPLGDAFDAPSSTPEGEALACEEATLRIVRQVIRSQPVRRRQVAVLYFLEEYEVQEIAETLSMARSTVRTHIARLREVLQPLVEPQARPVAGSEQP